jgi:hypothetical protein
VPFECPRKRGHITVPWVTVSERMLGECLLSLSVRASADTLWPRGLYSFRTDVGRVPFECPRKRGHITVPWVTVSERMLGECLLGVRASADTLQSRGLQFPNGSWASGFWVSAQARTRYGLVGYRFRTDVGRVPFECPRKRGHDTDPWVTVPCHTVSCHSVPCVTVSCHTASCHSVSGHSGSVYSVFSRVSRISQALSPGFPVFRDLLFAVYN